MVYISLCNSEVSYNQILLYICTQAAMDKVDKHIAQIQKRLK